MRPAAVADVFCTSLPGCCANPPKHCAQPATRATVNILVAREPFIVLSRPRRQERECIHPQGRVTSSGPLLSQNCHSRQERLAFGARRVCDMSVGPSNSWVNCQV